MEDTLETPEGFNFMSRLISRVATVSCRRELEIEAVREG